MRLFVAVNFPPDIRDALWRAATPLREGGWPVRWVDRDRIHLTVKFLGDVAADRVDAVGAAIAAAVEGTRRFRLGLQGFGAFPSPVRPRVIWIGCEPAPALELVQDTVERAMLELGFPLEGKIFRPHVTIGRPRAKAPPRAFAALRDQLEALDCYADTEVTTVDLMRSTLGSGGASYETLAQTELAS